MSKDDKKEIENDDKKKYKKKDKNEALFNVFPQMLSPKCLTTGHNYRDKDNDKYRDKDDVHFSPLRCFHPNVSQRDTLRAALPHRLLHRLLQLRRRLHHQVHERDHQKGGNC